MFSFLTWLRGFCTRLDTSTKFFPFGVRWMRVRRRMPAKPLAAPPGLRLTLLEDRWVPATFIVNNPTDTTVGGETDLRQAIASANASPGPSTITFDPTVFATPQTITLSGTELTLTNTTVTETITGPAAGVTISGNNASGVFAINSSVTASISGLTITGGYSNLLFGGGVSNSGTLTMTGCTVIDNVSNARGGGLANYATGTATLTDCTVSGNTGSYQGGGIENYGLLTVTDCTISNNKGAGSGGGGINTQGAATLIGIDSTISNNTSGNAGGGIAANSLVSLTGCTISGNSSGAGGGILAFSSAMTLTNCTVSGNTAINGGGGIYETYHNTVLKLIDTTVSGNTANTGGGIDNPTVGGGSFELGNTIVSANSATTNPDFAGTINTDDGYNLLGTALSGTTSDVFSDTPLLGPLGNYGGPTQTMLPMAGSPAIAAGNNTGGPSTDQRGITRVTSTGGDIGADEGILYTVTTNADGVAGSLRTDITAANSALGGSVIQFASGLSGNRILLAGTALPQITGNLQIDGLGASHLSISGNAASGVFSIHAGATAMLSGLTITGGKDVGGGGIYNMGTLTLTNCKVSGNTASFNGGGLYNAQVGGIYGTATLINCTISGNTVLKAGHYGVGGGVDNYGTLTLTNCTVSGNYAGNFGGGVLNGSGGFALTMTNCTVSGNTAYQNGGGVINYGTTATLTDCTISGNTAGNNAGGFDDGFNISILTNCTITGNTAANEGGGIYTYGATQTLLNCTVSANTAATGGGIWISRTGEILTIGNTIVSANAATATDPDIHGTIHTDEGHNLLGTALSGTTSGPGNVFSNTPRLTSLGYYGGPTETMALLPGSPALLNGNPSATGLPTTDERGFPRVVSSKVDIGAFQTQAQPFVVNTTNDTASGTEPSGDLSLRDAIHLANALDSIIPSDITFNIPTSDPGYLSGIYTISPVSALPTVSAPVVLDGTSEPGFGGTPVIDLSGASAGVNANGLQITASSTTVKGLAIGGFSDAGIVISSATGVTIEGDFIGTNAAGTAAVANNIGVEIISAAHNTIGGTAAVARNVISGNSIAGVYITGSSATANVVEGNYIGTDVSGTSAIPNAQGSGLAGVFVNAPDNTIGGVVAGAGNLISGNTGDANVLLQTAGGILAGNNLVAGNIIGADHTGLVALNGTNNGIDIQSSNNTIGGVTALARNVIVDSSNVGIAFQVSTTTGNLVEGNYIGVGSDGRTALANTNGGIAVFSDGGHQTIGGSAVGAGNVISGNGGYGILIQTDHNQVQGNIIGTDSTGTIAVSNVGDGIELNFNASSNTIGGTTVAARNLISGNGVDGVAVLGATSSGNVIEGNFVGVDGTGSHSLANGLSGGDGVYVEGANTIIGGSTTTPGTGAGNVISSNGQSSSNFGDIRIFGSGATGTLIEGNLVGLNSTGTAVVDATHSSYGIYLSGTHNVTVGGSVAGDRNVISGHVSYGVVLDNTGSATVTNNTIAGNYIGTDLNGSTALSPQAYGVELGAGATNNTIGGVTSTAGTAAGNVIGGGLYGIYMTSGTTTGNTIAGNLIGLKAGGMAAFGITNDGVRIDLGSGNTIGGTTPGAGNVISGNGNAGVDLFDASGNFVQENILGLNRTGNAAIPNSIGVQIVSSGGTASNNTIGGIATGNVISGNTNQGINITGSGAAANFVEGNFIGTNAAGTSPFVNGHGVEIQSGATNNIIGGDPTGEGNAIDFNTTYGVDIDGASTTGNTILGNTMFSNGTSGIAFTTGATAGTTAQPVVISLTTSPTSTSLVGSFTSTPNNTYDLNFFANTSGSQGQYYLGSTTVETDASGVAYFSPSWGSASSPGQVFTATVTWLGATGAQPSNTSTFSVLSIPTPTPHTPPTVSIKGPSADIVGLPVAFTSTVTDSNSTTPNLTYSWTVTGPGASALTGTGFALPDSIVTNQPTFDFTPTVSGKYSIQLAVNDGVSVVTSTTTLVAGPAGPGVVIGGLTQDIVPASTPVPLTGTLVSGTGATAVSYDWTVASSGTTYAQGTDQTFTFDEAHNGLYQVSLTVLDSEGKVSTSSVYVQVTSGLPVASILGLPSNAREGVPITVTAGGNDTGLTGPLLYSWTLTPPSPLAVISGSSSTFTFTPTESGAYAIKLTVTDKNNPTLSASKTVDFNVGALPPTASIKVTSGLTLGKATVGLPVTLTGTGNPASSGDPVTSYNWSVSSGYGNKITGSGQTFTYTPTTLGSEVVTLEVTGQSNSTGWTSITLDVVPPTIPSLTLSQTGTLQVGTTNSFTAQVPAPPSGVNYRFDWTVTGPANYTWTNSPTSPASTLKFTPSLAGTYKVTATATGSDGSVLTASKSYLVVAVPLTATIVGAPKTSLVGVPINLVDPVGYSSLLGPLTYTWTVTQNGITVDTSSNTHSTFSYTPTGTGAYQAKLMVADSHGDSANTSASFKVEPVPISPLQPVLPSLSIVEHISPVTSNGTTIAPKGVVLPGTAISFSADAHTTPGQYTGPLAYMWSITEPNHASLTGTGSTFNFTPTQTGSYAVTLTATNILEQSISTLASLVVSTTQPSVMIEYDSTTSQLTANVTDPGSSGVYSYQWYVNSVLSGTGSTFPFPGFTSSPVTVVVTDNLGSSATATTTFQMAASGTTLTPTGTPGTQVLAVAMGNAKIDATNLPPNVSVVEVALGGGDTLMGGQGPSVLQGDSGNNMLEGGIGPDTLIASLGDTLVGGTGPSNLFQINPGPGEVATAGTNSNTLSFATTSTGVNVNLGQSGTQTVAPGDSLTLSGAFQTLIGGGGNDNLIAGRASKVLMFGGTGDDTLSASGGSSISLVGGTGNDTLSASSETNAVLISGLGNAVLTQTGGSSITMFGGTGNDTLSSTGGSSITLVGGTGNDTLSSSGGTGLLLQGGAGNSQLLTQTGGSSITMFGGTGNDTLSPSGGSSITLVGGTGNDTLSSTGGIGIVLQGAAGNSILMQTGGSSITMFGGTGNDTLSSTGGSSITLVAGTGSDTVSTNSSGSLLLGGAGTALLTQTGGSSITMFGGTGNDTLSSTGGSSITLVAGTGNDSLSSISQSSNPASNILLQGGSGSAILTQTGGSSITMFGGTGNDTLSSSGGSSITLVGGTGNDSLSSTGGNSVLLQGGAGNSTMLTQTGGSSITMFGGTGNDTLSSSGGSSITLVGGTGNDTLSSVNGNGVGLSGGSGNAVLTQSGGSSITMFGGTGNDTLSASGGSSITLVGGTGSDTLSTSDSGSLLLAGSGNAVLTQTGGSSITMFGGTGNDTLSSSGGSSITLVGGSGSDTLSSNGTSSVLQQGGTGNAQLLTQTGGSSITMFGGTGNDTLSSSGGSSITLVGGTGNDTLSSSGDVGVVLAGGTGNAQLLTQTGGSSITMFGGTGNDSLSSSGGSSISLVAGTGNDTLSSSGGSGILLVGGSGNSQTLTQTGGTSITMFGGTGNDTLSSSGGSSITLVGGSGNDSLSSTGGSSVLLQGGGGNAVTVLTQTGGSSITMFGGTGNDSLSSSGGSSITLVGGSGNDSLSSTGGTGVVLQGGTGNAQLLTQTGGSSITMFGGTGNDTLSSSGGSSITLVGGSGNDTLSSSGSASNVLLQGGSGNAVLLTQTGGSSITMFGGTGNDTLSSSGGTSITLVGGTGNDSLSSTNGNSVSMVGGSGNSVLLTQSGGSSITMFGGTGNDTLSSSGGSSITLVGGTGNDSLSSTGGSGVLSVGGSGNSVLTQTGGSSITMFGGTGNDTLSSSGGSSITLIGGTGNDSLSSTGGSSVLLLGDSGNAVLTQSGGSSITMFGGTGNDTLSSSGGSSITLLGGTGNDSLSSSNSNDLLMTGGSGNSVLTQTAGSSITMFGGTGNDTLSSSGGSSISLVGGSGSDTLSASNDMTALLMSGGPSGDLLTSTGGSSITMFGGAGNDTLSATGGSVSMDGKNGNNTYQVSGSLAHPIAVTINTLATTGQNVAQDDSQSNAINTLEFPGIGRPGSPGIDLNLGNASTGPAITSSQMQTVAPGVVLAITGTFQQVDGTAGNDTIISGSGNTNINGEGGNDLLAGGSGNTTVTAGSGNDTLDAGSGNTNFVFNQNSVGNDAVDPPTSTGTNTLDFSAFGSAVALNLASTATQSVGTGLQLTLQNPGELNALVDSSFNDSIIGNAAGDSFYLGTGNDSFTGGGGNDTFYFAGNQLGSDTINEPSTIGGDALNFYGFGGPINLNLTQTGKQFLDQTNSSSLTLTLSNPAAFSTIVGTLYPDSITGNNDANETIIGGGGDDSLVAGSGKRRLYAGLRYPGCLSRFPHAYPDPSWQPCIYAPGRGRHSAGVGGRLLRLQLRVHAEPVHG